MRAVLQDSYGPVTDLRLGEHPKPSAADDAVLVRVCAAGVDPGIWHMKTGRPYFARLAGIGFGRPKNPIAGWDVAGVIEAVGAKVTRFAVGDEVFGNCDTRGTGTFAEYACVPESRCCVKPANLTLEEAAAMAVSGCTALQCVRDLGHVGEGSRVLVIGAGGGVGHFAVQIARAYSAWVTAVCASDKTDFVRSLGANAVIDYTREPLDTQGVGYDLIVDTAGMRPLRELRRLLAPDGVLAIVGGEGGNVLTGRFLERALGAAMGSLFSKQTLRVVVATVTADDLSALRKLTERGHLKPAISERYPLERAVEAVQTLERGHARGKSIVVL